MIKYSGDKSRTSLGQCRYCEREELRTLILLTNFAESRNEKPDTIRKYINRHKDEFEGHCSFCGTKMEIDDYAEKMLDQLYPLPKPVEIIEDTESRKELIKAQKLIIQLQQKISEQSLALAQAEATKILLEDKEEQLKEKRNELDEKKIELDEAKQEISSQRARADAEKAKAEEAQREIDRLKNRGLLERILNK